ncbi:MAG: N-acetylglucosamine-6-phosphate deacetylase [Sphingomicrobium sp.]
MIVRIFNGQIVTSSEVIARASIHIEQGTIVGIEPVDSAVADIVIDLDGGWLLPGFIDAQVNGGGGVLFNDRPSVETIATIGATHARFGTTAFLPTLISDTPARIAQALDAVDAAIERGVPGVVGIHVEGPFINAAKRGIHDAHRICRLDDETLELLTRPRRGKVVVTLAPELCDIRDVQTLAERGVIVSAGHTDASYDVAQQAIAAGVRGFTHLFNAMSALHHREPGAVGAALDSDSFCGIIVDGMHLHPAAVRIAVKAKGVERLMLVTDAMPSVGTNDTEFVLQGKRILVREGTCIFEDSTLAGANLDMASALRNAVATTGLEVSEAARMASTTPAHFLSLQESHGTIASGQRADWVWLDANLQPRGTWIGGVAIGQTSVPLACAAQ